MRQTPDIRQTAITSLAPGPPQPGRPVSAWSRYFAEIIFAESLPIEGTPGWTYLGTVCGIDPRLLPAEVLVQIRYHPECPESTGGPRFPRHPALVIASRDPNSPERVRGLHRTFITADGSRKLAPTAGLRPVLGSVPGLVVGRIRAGCRIVEAQTVDEVLSALGSQQFDAGLATIAPAYLGRRQLPRDCKCTILGNRPNYKEARVAAERRAGRANTTVGFVTPPPPFADLPELLRSQGVHAAAQLVSAAEPIGGARLPKTVLFRDLSLPLSHAYVVKGLLGAGELSVMFGPPGSLKSFLAIDIAMHVALGLPWQGRRVCSGAVLYVALEEIAGVRRRFIGQRLAMEHGGSAQLSKVPLGVLYTDLDLCASEADVTQLLEEIRVVADRVSSPLRLVVIDTLARAMGQGDENSGPDMGALLRNVGRIQAETGAHVLIIHHVGKDPARGLRGHSSLLAALDTAIETKRERSGRATATVVKQKDGPEGQTFHFELLPIEIGRDDDGDAIETARVRSIKPNAKPSATKPSQLSRQHEKALGVLATIIEHDGVPVPGHDGCRGIGREAWREECIKAEVIQSDKPDSIRRSFQRLEDGLVAAGRVRTAGDWVWLR